MSSRRVGLAGRRLLERLEGAFGAQRQFVANASHELRSPLARQRTLIEVALADPEPSVTALQHLCKRLLASGEQSERLIEALLTLARSQRGLDRRDPIDLAAIANEVVRARQAEARQRGITVHACLCHARALGDGRLAERLVANLLDNAMRYNVADGTVDVTISQVGPDSAAAPCPSRGRPPQPPRCRSGGRPPSPRGRTATRSCFPSPIPARHRS